MFFSFKKTYPCSNIEEVKKFLDKKDISICFCGSDQIWNPTCYDPVYYMDFGQEYKFSKVAYAPSIISKEQLKYYSTTLQKMKQS